MWAPVGVGSLITVVLPFAVHMASLFDWLHSLHVTFLGRHPIILGSTTSRGLHYSLGVTLTASHITLSVATYRNSYFVTYYMDSQIFL
jgi:hypothetical protein